MPLTGKRRAPFFPSIELPWERKLALRQLGPIYTRLPYDYIVEASSPVLLLPDGGGMAIHDGDGPEVRLSLVVDHLELRPAPAEIPSRRPLEGVTAAHGKRHVVGHV